MTKLDVQWNIRPCWGKTDANWMPRNGITRERGTYIYIHREVIRSGVEQTKANGKCVGVSRYKKEEYYRMLRQREKEREQTAGSCLETGWNLNNRQLGTNRAWISSEIRSVALTCKNTTSEIEIVKGCFFGGHRRANNHTTTWFHQADYGRHLDDELWIRWILEFLKWHFLLAISFGRRSFLPIYR